MDKDYYKILGVSESDSAEDIKQAYRRLVRRWHPDIAGSNADVVRRFKEINEAYEVLSSNIKKSDYDKARKFYNYARNGFESENKDFGDLSRQSQVKNSSYFKNFSSTFEDLFNKQKKEDNCKNEKVFPKRGEDIYTEVEISVFEAINGTEKIVNVLQTASCPKCRGRKFINGSVCQNCNGEGIVNRYKKFTVKVPAGIKNGAKMRLSKEGGIGSNGGANGDLYIKVKIKEDSDYKTDGLNIIKTVYIAPYEAVLGSNVQIKTLNGNYTVRINPSTQNGQKIRLSGCGIVQNGKIGDMIIVLEIRVPKKISLEELELYRKLSEISSQNVRESIND